MNALEKFLYALQAPMTTPQPYGLWHITCMLIVAALTVFLVLRFRDTDDKTLRRILLIAWVAMVVSEIYKQVIFAFDCDGLTTAWSYAWYAFPFQFCSTPLYALPFVIFLKDGPVRDAVIAFLSTFSLFAGLAVMLYPGDVFISYIGINVQTMLHHGLQVALGIYLAAYCRRRMNRRKFLSGLAVFAAFVAVAMTLNIAMHHIHLAAGIDATFNMFYISPYHNCTLPVLSVIDPLLPYPVFLMVYLLGFALVSALVYGAEKGVIALIDRHAKHHEAH
ncbi:MAG: YwaF family protein [Clostridia bacterium]|nr:YwaF family protein [Clostridia bacterium]